MADDLALTLTLSEIGVWLPPPPDGRVFPRTGVTLTAQMVGVPDTSDESKTADLWQHLHFRVTVTEGRGFGTGATICAAVLGTRIGLHPKRELKVESLLPPLPPVAVDVSPTPSRGVPGTNVEGGQNGGQEGGREGTPMKGARRGVEIEVEDDEEGGEGGAESQNDEARLMQREEERRDSSWVLSVPIPCRPSHKWEPDDVESCESLPFALMVFQPAKKGSNGASRGGRRGRGVAAEVGASSSSEEDSDDDSDADSDEQPEQSESEDDVDERLLGSIPRISLAQILAASSSPQGAIWDVAAPHTGEEPPAKLTLKGA